MATITDGTLTTTPDLTIGWQSSRAPQSVAHTILNRADPDITLRLSANRTGTLHLFYKSYGLALAAESMLSGALIFTLTPTGSDPALGMTFAVSGGDMELTSATDEARQWLLSVPFVQVTP